MGTHHLIPNIRPFLAFHHGTMDVGNKLVSVRNALTNVRNCYMSMQRKFCLEMKGQQRGQRIDGRTYLKDMRDSIEIRPPGNNRVFITLRVEKTRDGVSSVRFHNALLDQRHGPAIVCVVSKSGTASISIDSTHVVNCSIASNTDRVS